MEDLQNLISPALEGQMQTTLPEISRDEITIKEQNYGNLSEEKAKEQRGEDFYDYIASVLYIFASNSPKPITSSNDISSVISQISQQIITAVGSRNAEALADLSKSGEEILKQMKAMEVPEDLVDIHIKAMQYAMYAQSLKDFISPSAEDPLKDIANLAQVGALAQNLMSFSSDIQEKMSQYNIDYSKVQEKVNAFGVNLPDEKELESLSSAISSTGE